MAGPAGARRQDHRTSLLDRQSSYGSCQSMWLLTAGDKSSSRRGQTRHIAACLASLVRYRARGAVSLSLFRSRGKRLRLLIIDKYTLTGFDEALVCLGVGLYSIFALSRLALTVTAIQSLFCILRVLHDKKFNFVSGLLKTSVL